MDKVCVRYIVDDMEAALAFYTGMLGFDLDFHPAPGFARLVRGNLAMLLNRPGAGGAGQPADDGRMPEPGGWNRVQIVVDDIDASVKTLTQAGCGFRSAVVEGNGGRQVLVEDPSGNPVELFQPYPDAPAQ